MPPKALDGRRRPPPAPAARRRRRRPPTGPASRSCSSWAAARVGGRAVSMWAITTAAPSPVSTHREGPPEADPAPGDHGRAALESHSSSSVGDGAAPGVGRSCLRATADDSSIAHRVTVLRARSRSPSGHRSVERCRRPRCQAFTSSSRQSTSSSASCMLRSRSSMTHDPIGSVSAHRLIHRRCCR